MSCTRADRLPRPAPSDAGLRVSDREREDAASALREHTAAGRLTVEELTVRLDAALGARTRGELDRQLADLPRLRGASGAGGAKAAGMRAHTRAYVWVSLGMVGLWAATGAGYFWPVWPILGWGIGVVAHVGACGRYFNRKALIRSS